MPPIVKRWVGAWSATVVSVALVTGVIKLAHPEGPARGLTALYVLVVLLIAVRWGPAFAFGSALLSVAAIDIFFIDRRPALKLPGVTDLETVGAYLVTAIIVGLLASRLRRQAQDAARLAAEQQSLRRVASLVARGGLPATVLVGIADELNQLAGAEVALLFHRDVTGRMELAAAAGVPIGAVAAIGTPGSAEPRALTTTIRFDSNHHLDNFGPASDAILGLHLASGIAGPVAVDGRVWGFIVVATRAGTLAPSAERRVSDYVDLLATAIDNTETRAELKASRTRIITASDETRRQIERNLHDGAQQQLVSLALAVRSVRLSVPPEEDELRTELLQVADGIVSVLDELREMARGLHPAILSEGGLQPALQMLARRSPVAVEIDANVGQRLPEQIEVTAYYVASELLANTAKHARANTVRMRAEVTANELMLSIRDDGVGGADATRGSGLVGVLDRVSANNGTITLTSPIGHGTRADVILPIKESTG